MGDEKSSSELRKTWELAAPGWAKWEKLFAAGLTDVTDELIDMAGIMPGQRVLDLACGAGRRSIMAAKRVGVSGCVVASDISATMLEHVHKNAKLEGLENIETTASPAEDLEASQHPFDAAICRLGLMLFPAPGSALEAVQRVLKPRAILAAVSRIRQLGCDSIKVASRFSILVKLGYASRSGVSTCISSRSSCGC